MLNRLFSVLINVIPINECVSYYRYQCVPLSTIIVLHISVIQSAIGGWWCMHGVEFHHLVSMVSLALKKCVSFTVLSYVLVTSIQTSILEDHSSTTILWID